MYISSSDYKSADGVLFYINLYCTAIPAAVYPDLWAGGSYRRVICIERGKLLQCR